MSFYMNKVILVGRAGADPEAATLPSGDTVVNISLCTDKRRRNGAGEWTSNPQWHNVSVGGQAATYALANNKKGDLVHVEGSLNYRRQDVEKGQPPRTNILAHLIERAARPKRDGAGSGVDEDWINDYDNAQGSGLR
jgi:single-strand DNA-binding protein